jgi:hypothetical protein
MGCRWDQPEVLVEAIGVDDLAGVHLPVGVRQAPELPERLHEVVTERAGSSAPDWPSPVLAGEGTAEAQHQLGRLLREGPVVGDAVARPQVEVHAGVDAAVTKWP